MSTIWLGKHTLLKSYSGSVKGAKSVVRIELEVSEPGALGFLLEELGGIVSEQQAAKRASAKAGNKKQAALATPLLQLPYHGGTK